MEALLKDAQAFVFDLDGTLVDTEPVGAQALREVISTLGKSFTLEHEQAIVGKAWPNVLDYLVRELHLTIDPDQLRQQITTTYLNLLDQHLPVLPGALECVRLAALMKPLSLVSGSSRAQIDYLLDKMDISDCFTTTYAIEDYKVSKPSPEGYLMAARSLLVEPDRCVVFEDSPAGIASAKNAGMIAIGVTCANHHKLKLVGADLEIESLEWVVNAFQSMDGPA